MQKISKHYQEIYKFANCWLECSSRYCFDEKVAQHRKYAARPKCDMDLKGRFGQRAVGRLPICKLGMCAGVPKILEFRGHRDTV